MQKKYKCPYDDFKGTKEELAVHIEENYPEMIPKGYTASRFVFKLIYNKDHGTCVVCKRDTDWNENSQKYNRLCGRKECKEKLRETYKNNMLKARGTYNILNDPKQQEKMLKNRGISGKYKFTDGGYHIYTGSYEKKALEFIDKVLGFSSDDILSPGPTIEYEYNGEKHTWITDIMIVPLNLIIEVKDGGDNPNKREMPSYRAKQIEKERFITNLGTYNYLRLTNNNFEQLLEIIAELKSQMIDDSDENKKVIINIHEEANVLSEGIISTAKEILNPHNEVDSIKRKNNYRDAVTICKNSLSDCSMKFKKCISINPNKDYNKSSYDQFISGDFKYASLGDYNAWKYGNIRDENIYNAYFKEQNEYLKKCNKKLNNENFKILIEDDWDEGSIIIKEISKKGIFREDKIEESYITEINETLESVESYLNEVSKEYDVPDVITESNDLFYENLNLEFDYNFNNYNVLSEIKTIDEGVLGNIANFIKSILTKIIKAIVYLWKKLVLFVKTVITKIGQFIFGKYNPLGIIVDKTVQLIHLEDASLDNKQIKNTKIKDAALESVSGILKEINKRSKEQIKYITEYDKYLRSNKINEVVAYGMAFKTNSDLKLFKYDTKSSYDLSFTAPSFDMMEYYSDITLLNEKRINAVLEAKNVVEEYNNLINGLWTDVENRFTQNILTQGEFNIGQIMDFLQATINPKTNEFFTPQEVNELASKQIFMTDIKDPELIKTILKLRLNYNKKAIECLKKMAVYNYQVLGASTSDINELLSNIEAKDKDTIYQLYRSLMKNVDKFIVKDGWIDYHSIGGGEIFYAVLNDSYTPVEDEVMYDCVYNPVPYYNYSTRYDCIISSHGGDPLIYLPNNMPKDKWETMVQYKKNSNLDNIDKEISELNENFITEVSKLKVYYIQRKEEFNTFTKNLESIIPNSSAKKREEIKKQFKEEYYKFTKYKKETEDKIRKLNVEFNKQLKDLYAKAEPDIDNLEKLGAKKSIHTCWPVSIRNERPKKLIREVLLDAIHNNFKRILLSSCNPGDIPLDKDIASHNVIIHMAHQSVLSDGMPFRVEDDPTKPVSKEERFSKSMARYESTAINEIKSMNVFFSEDDVEINLRKFINRQIPILYVTGIPGSGKSTTAKDICNKMEATYIELDQLHLNPTLKIYWNSYLFKYLDSIHKTHEEIHDIINKSSYEEYISIIKDYVDFIIKDSSNSNQFVIEGLQIAPLYKFYPEIFKRNNYAIIFKNTSIVTSAYRRFNRDGDRVSDIPSYMRDYYRWGKYQNYMRNNFDKKDIDESTYINENKEYDRYKKQYKNFDEFCNSMDTPTDVLNWTKINNCKWPEHYSIFGSVPFYWPDDILKNKIGTCIDFSLFMHYFCERKGIENYIVRFARFNRSYGENEYKCSQHFVSIFKENGLYYVYSYNGWNKYGFLGPYKNTYDAIKYLCRIMKNHFIGTTTFKTIFGIETKDEDVRDKKEFKAILDPKEFKEIDKFYGDSKIRRDDFFFVCKYCPSIVSKYDNGEANLRMDYWGLINEKIKHYPDYLKAKIIWKLYGL